MHSSNSKNRFKLLALGLLGLAACSGESSSGLPPTVEILRPVDGDAFSVGREIPLNCVARSADEGGSVSIEWTAFPGGRGPAVFLSDEADDSTGALSVGVHQIACTATEGDLQNNDLVTITITNEAPTVTIVNPDPTGALEFFESEAIAFVGSVFDPDLNAHLEDLRWDLTAISGGFSMEIPTGARGSIEGGTLTPGEYQLMAYVFDELGEVASTWIIFEVLADPIDAPPVIVDGIVAASPIDSNDNPPASYFVEQCLVDINGDGFHDGSDLCQRLTINATVTDDHDAPEDLVYTWTVRKDGGPFDMFTTPTSVTTLDLEPGQYRVQLVATDTAGNDSRPFNFVFTIATLI